MSQEELKKRIAQLEFQNDQLASELKYIDLLLKSIGFPQGIETVKQAAEDLMDQGAGEELF